MVINYIRSVNYHCTPSCFTHQFEQHLKFFHDHYSNVTQEELKNFLRGTKWNKQKPGLIISFYDRLRSNYDYAAPLLEKFGFTGWFVIPPGFIQAEKKHQKAYAVENNICCKTNYNERIAMSWNELRDLLGRGHHISSHTYGHVRLPESLNTDLIDFEIRQSKNLLEQHLDIPISSFVWVGGEKQNFCLYAIDAIRDAGYNFSFNSNDGIILNRTDHSVWVK